MQVQVQELRFACCGRTLGSVPVHRAVLERESTVLKDAPEQPTLTIDCPSEDTARALAGYWRRSAVSSLGAGVGDLFLLASWPWFEPDQQQQHEHAERSVVEEGLPRELHAQLDKLGMLHALGVMERRVKNALELGLASAVELLKLYDYHPRIVLLIAEVADSLRRGVTEAPTVGALTRKLRGLPLFVVLARHAEGTTFAEGYVVARVDALRKRKRAQVVGALSDERLKSGVVQELRRYLRGGWLKPDTTHIVLAVPDVGGAAGHAEEVSIDLRGWAMSGYNDDVDDEDEDGEDVVEPETIERGDLETWLRAHNLASHEAAGEAGLADLIVDHENAVLYSRTAALRAMAHAEVTIVDGADEDDA